ncbi:hypothetical protein M8542_49425 [Amycolatopsis sp. OK19-0408]|uniref:Secreted protein n=1 Tax=Amycolatopsis iheyensis TaxID=2945988 RepID=A0A9X2NPV1_9PSEU|nr:hypothetical protein [Amycolatopsis iheyensis]MCR6490832.1 hypothetical protein [Amycolatopsis iheyensis]
MMKTLARVLAVTAFAGAVAVTGAGAASASTDAGPVCPGLSGGVGSSYTTVTCTSGPGTTYAVYIECTNGKAYAGPFVRYNPGLWSERDCPTGFKVTRWGVLTS